MYGITDTYDFSDSFLTINAQWDSIRESFIEYIEDGLNLAVQKENKLLEVIGKWYLDKHPDYIEDILTDGNRKNYYYKSTFLNSGLMFIFSQFESSLGEILISTREFFEKNNKKTKSYKSCIFCKKKDAIQEDKNIIGRRKKEIIKLSSIQIKFESHLKKHWDKIVDFQKIRNIITHGNGITKKRKLVIRFNSNYPTLKIIEHLDNTYNLFLSKEILLQIEKEMTLFLKGLMELIYESNKIRKKYSNL